MLCNLDEQKCTKCQKYWPDDSSHFRHGMFLIESVSVTQKSNYIHRIFYLKWNNKTRTVHQFQYLSWAMKGVPASVKSFTGFVKQLIEVSDKKYPVVVHSE